MLTAHYEVLMSLRCLSTLAIAAALALPHASVAQIPSVSFGVAGGVNSSTSTKGTTFEDVDAKRRTGLIAGAFMALGIMPMALIESGLYYSQQGVTFRDDPTDSELYAKLTYLQVPLLLKLTTPVSVPSGFRPFVVVGPAVGVLWSCEISGSDVSVTNTYDCKDTSDPDELKAKSMDVSLVAGVGADAGPWTFSIRYWHGMTKYDDSPAKEDVRNRVISAMMGFAFFGR